MALILLGEVIRWKLNGELHLHALTTLIDFVVILYVVLDLCLITYLVIGIDATFIPHSIGCDNYITAW